MPYRYKRKRRYARPVRRSFRRSFKKKRVFRSKLRDLVKSVEMKRIFQTRAFSTLGIPENLFYANSISRGTGQGQRIGNKVLLKYFECRIFIRQDATLPSNLFRVMLVHAKTPSIAADPTDVFASSAQLFDSMYSIDNAGQYAVLIDKVYNFSVTGNLTRYVHWRKKLNIEVRYVEGLTSEEQQELILMLIPRIALPSSFAVSLDSRVKFVDL